MGCTWRLVLPLILLTGADCLASPATLPVYDVEMVIFAYAANRANASAEKLPSLPDMDDTQPPFGPDAVAMTLRRLRETWQRLKTLPGHRPLMQLAWRQPLPDPHQGIPFRIQYPTTRDGQEGPQLIGTVSLSRYRSAILRIDLALLEQGRVYRLRKTARMQRHEVHYLDHPMLGVFATLTKVQ
jgi:hypothetical protein